MFYVAVLAFDTKGTFDNVAHEAPLENFINTNRGITTYNFATTFPTNRTAPHRLDPHVSPTFNSPAKA